MHSLLCLSPSVYLSFYLCFCLSVSVSLYLFLPLLDTTDLFRCLSFFLNSLSPSNPLPSLQDIFLKCKSNLFTLMLKTHQQAPYCFGNAVQTLKASLHNQTVYFQLSYLIWTFFPYLTSFYPPQSSLIIQNSKFPKSTFSLILSA